MRERRVARSTSRMAARLCLVRHPVLRDIAVGPDRDVEARSVDARDHVLGPVMIDGTRGQIDDLLARLRDLRGARSVGKAQNRVGAGDVQIVADERHSERRIESLQEHRPRVRDAGTAGVAQQRDSIRARDARTRAAHHGLHEPALDAFAVVRLWRRIGFGDQHVAVGQDVEPAGMLQSLGESIDRKSRAPGGVAPAGHPLAGAIFTVGISAGTGFASWGDAP